MPASPITVNRTDDPSSGDDFKVYEDINTPARLVQAVAEDPDVSGRVLTWATTGGTAVEAVNIKATSGVVFRVDVALTTPFPTDRWLMVFNIATAPTASAVPVLRKRVTNGEASIDLGKLGMELAAGIGVAVSTTVGVLTLPGGGEAYFQVGYI